MRNSNGGSGLAREERLQILSRLSAWLSSMVAMFV